MRLQSVFSLICCIFSPSSFDFAVPLLLSCCSHSSSPSLKFSLSTLSCHCLTFSASLCSECAQLSCALGYYPLLLLQLHPKYFPVSSSTWLSCCPSIISSLFLVCVSDRDVGLVCRTFIPSPLLAALWSWVKHLISTSVVFSVDWDEYIMAFFFFLL